ncbi:tetraspanin Pls1 family [Lentinula boryana]|uniref:Tetraspanin Pls1 family n=1 Tax=Lentinula boryana TaxID=40481 RepID=A0ABQ8Q5S1_9AGAR|nr:tetraspanin Pls1 family [Lentinula boryana]
MVSRKLMGFWALFDVCLLAAGVVSIVFSVVYRKQDILLNLTISKADLTAALIMGIMLVATFVFSIGAIVQKNHVTMGLVILNYLLVADAIVVLVIGSFVWFFSLQQRNNFHKLYVELPASSRVFIQDKFSCCGYFNGSDAVEPSTFCTPSQIAFTNALDPSDVNNADSFCVTEVTAFTDYTLNQMFSYTYGFMPVVLGLLLFTLCVINKRKEGERFKKIDAKRGGRGFV